MRFSILTFFTVTSIVSIVARTLRGASVRFYITSTSIVAIHCGTGICNIFSKILKGFSRFDWMIKILYRICMCVECPKLRYVYHVRNIVQSILEGRNIEDHHYDP